VTAGSSHPAEPHHDSPRTRAPAFSTAGWLPSQTSGAPVTSNLRKFSARPPGRDTRVGSTWNIRGGLNDTLLAGAAHRRLVSRALRCGPLITAIQCHRHGMGERLVMDPHPDAGVKGSTYGDDAQGLRRMITPTPKATDMRSADRQKAVAGPRSSGTMEGCSTWNIGGGGRVTAGKRRVIAAGRRSPGSCR
jgi:hypothetical protein